MKSTFFNIAFLVSITCAFNICAEKLHTTFEYRETKKSETAEDAIILSIENKIELSAEDNKKHVVTFEHFTVHIAVEKKNEQYEVNCEITKSGETVSKPYIVIEKNKPGKVCFKENSPANENSLIITASIEE